MEYNAPFYGEHGLEIFQSIAKEQMQKHGMRMFGAYDGNALLGVLIFSREHITLLFIDGKQQRPGDCPLTY